MTGKSATNVVDVCTLYEAFNTRTMWVSQRRNYQ